MHVLYHYKGVVVYCTLLDCTSRPSVSLSKSSSSSCERSSKLLFIVSGNSKVEKTPVNMKSAKISRIWGRNLPVPPILMSREKPTCAMIAPSFPLAAQIPCAVDLYRVGKTSPGMMNVVVLGPKFWKKLAMQY